MRMTPGLGAREMLTAEVQELDSRLKAFQLLIRPETFQPCELACSFVKTPENLAAEDQRGGDVKQIIGAKSVPGGVAACKIFGAVEHFGQWNFAHGKKSAM